MSQKVISLRISSALLDRLDHMVDILKEDPKRSPRGNLTRAEIIRESIIRGCDAIELDSRPGSTNTTVFSNKNHTWHDLDNDLEINPSPPARHKNSSGERATVWQYHDKEFEPLLKQLTQK